MASGVATTPEFTYEPSPWIDFFAAYEPLPLQVYMHALFGRHLVFYL
jgi:hypothetical protein